MRIENVCIYKVILPFRGDFAHSRRKGATAKNIVVETITDNPNIRGYGEGAPREYVTGESQDSVLENLGKMIGSRCFPWELKDVSQIWDFVEYQHEGKENNAGICALEMSLLDALGKENRESILEYFPKTFLRKRIYYSATIPLSDERRILEICKICKKIGINSLRLKMGKDVNQNQKALETVRNVFNTDCDLRIDVNGAWDKELAISNMFLIDKYRIKIIEQPMMPNDSGIIEVANMMRRNNVILMADESACSINDLELLTELGSYEMINVRLSKCGGFYRSLKMLNLIRSSGFSFQIGCQLGESGLLSAAGRILGLLNGDAKYYDGSYDDFLLSKNITVDNVCFGPRGEAEALGGPGLGVEVDRKHLNQLSEVSSKITISRN